MEPDRGVIIARIEPRSTDRIAEIFRRSDATELPTLAGVVRRELYCLGDLYVHVVETRTGLEDTVEAIGDHPLFTSVSRELQPFVRPYDPTTWKGPRDASARRFYSWSAP